jgi:hypothetical protein
MNRNPRALVVTLIAFAAGAYLFWRAMQGGGPLFYFLSAVGFGMGIASLQRGPGGGGTR